MKGIFTASSAASLRAHPLMTFPGGSAQLSLGVVHVLQHRGVKRKEEVFPAETPAEGDPTHLGIQRGAAGVSRERHGVVSCSYQVPPPLGCLDSVACALWHLITPQTSLSLP